MTTFDMVCAFVVWLMVVLLINHLEKHLEAKEEDEHAAACRDKPKNDDQGDWF